MEEAVEMAAVAAAGGTETMLCTPHRRDVTESSSVEQVKSLIADMAAELRSREIQLELLLGMENHIDLDLPDELDAGRALSMNGGSYILVEMPFFGHQNYVEDVLFRLQVQGARPVLAHPERIEAVQRDPELLAGLVERGMLSQVTGGSVVGHFGREVRRFTHSLLRRGLVHVIASDTHTASGPRSPRLSACVEAAAEIVGAERARALVVDTPRAILEGTPVEVEPPSADPRPRRWWQMWRQ